MGEKYNLQWSGTLTAENVNQVVKLLRKLLKNKRFTTVSVHMDGKFVPFVRTGRQLDKRMGNTSIQALTSYGDVLYINTLDFTWGIKVDSSKPSRVTFNTDQVAIRYWEEDRGVDIYLVFAVEPEDKR